MVYGGQGQTKAERIIGQDKKFVMVNQNAGLIGVAALGRDRERKSLMAYSNVFIYYIFGFSSYPWPGYAHAPLTQH